MRRLPFLLLALLCVLFNMTSASVSAQTDQTLLITELMYHPPAEQKKAEFLELYNPGPDFIDVSGWCFEGIAFCFPSGTIMEAQRYIVLTRDERDFAETYAQDADFEYQGKLSNAGETIGLLNAQQQIVDTVTYSDQSPWPSSPDGNGDSLSLISLEADNSQPYAWQASAPSPKQANPTIENAIQILNAAVEFTDTTTLISANIVNADSVTLTYRINFDAPLTVEMTSADDTYSAELPTFSSGDLFRYRIDAQRDIQQVSLPRNNAMAYTGQVIPDTIETNIPVLHIFDNESETILGIENQIWENVTFAVRGRASQEFPRKNYKIDLAKGDEMQPAFLDFPVDEFALQGSGYEPSYLRQYLAWDAVRRYGLPEHQVHFVRVHRNGDYFGLFTFLEMPDGNWRERHGLADHAVYKAIPIYDENRGIYEKRTQLDADWSELDDLNSCIASAVITELETCLSRLVDVPQVINELAVMSAIRQADQGFHNFYLYYDGDGNARWTLLPWDLDLTYGRQDRNWNIGGPRTDLATVHAAYEFCPLCKAILSIPAYEQAYLRRLRTVADDYYADNTLEQQIDTLLALIEPELTLEREIWDFESSTPEETQIFFSERFVAAYRENLLTNGSDTGTVPATQQTPNINIAPVSIQATAKDQPYLEFEIENLGDDWLDISGWQIGNTTVPNGNVIAPSGTHRLSTRLTETVQNKSSVLIGETDFSKATHTITTHDGTTITTVTVNNPITAPSPTATPSAETMTAPEPTSPINTTWIWIAITAATVLALLVAIRRK